MSEKKSLIASLISDTGSSEVDLKRLIARAPHSYKVYSIPKNSGGYRIIAQPAKETKFLQRWLISNVLHKLPVSKNATAYAKGASIKKNAIPHAKNNYLLKMDFKDFFNSITHKQVKKHLKLKLDLDTKEAELISRLACVRYKKATIECLSVGAPSSPLISNSIMFDFDVILDNWCKDNAVVYTRYADDIVLSTNRKDFTNIIENKVKEILKSFSKLGLTLNDKKTTHLSKKHNRSVTGLTISNDGKVTIGRNRKREISKSIFLYSKGLLKPSEIDTLQGLLGFAKHIDPLFIHKLERKFEYKLLHEIFSHRKENDS
jgi:RNA-directed DNA polymerase